MPLALVTCGPAHEPVDAVRRITNQSTGQLGTLLCEALVENDFRVICLRGEGATHPGPTDCQTVPFSTNASLEALLSTLTDRPAVVFHAAALCDYGVADGPRMPSKIPSDLPELRLVLQPLPKLLPRLKPLFPDAIVVGWKLELDGNPATAIERARLQIQKAATNASVVNGSAYGQGFGFLEREREGIRHFPDKLSLCRFLAGWARSLLPA